MSKIKRLAGYAKGTCPLYEDLDTKERAQFEAEFNKEGESIYTDYVKHEVREDGVLYTYYCSICKMEHERLLPAETDFVYVGSCPSEEDPFKKYTSWQTCNALKIQLINTFGRPPEGGRVYIKCESGGGGYYEVAAEFDTRFPMSVAYALMLEAELPTHWSPAAKRFLDNIGK